MAPRKDSKARAPNFSRPEGIGPPRTKEEVVEGNVNDTKLTKQEAAELLFNEGQSWTVGEDRYMAKCQAGDMPWQTLAYDLGRSNLACRIRWCHLGKTDKRDRLEKEFGVSAKTLRKRALAERRRAAEAESGRSGRSTQRKRRCLTASRLKVAKRTLAPAPSKTELSYGDIVIDSEGRTQKFEDIYVSGD